jgi:hypothetical protein
MQEEARIAALALRIDDPWRDAMKTPEEVAAMLRLKELGCGAKRIACEFGSSYHTVRRYVVGGFVAYRQARRAKKLDGLEDWLKERFRRHRGNADVIRQELTTEKAIIVSLCTVQRAVAASHLMIFDASVALFSRGISNMASNLHLSS